MPRESRPDAGTTAPPRLGRRALVRRAGLVAVGLAALPALAACRSTAPAPGTPEAVPDPAPAPPDPTPPPTPTPVVHRGAALRLWALGSIAPAADRQLAALAAEWAREQGATATVEFMAESALRARLAAPGATGADIVQCRDNWAWRWPAQFADLWQEAGAIEAAAGGCLDAPAMHGRVDGTWLALPFSVAPTAIIYRADWHRAAGVAAFPGTLDGLLAAGKALKAAGRPFGASAGRSSDDPRALWSAVLWAFGGREVEADGKTIAIGAPETRAALDWAAQFWGAACAADGLTWDDNANNRLYANGQIAATQNNPAIYLYAKDALPDLAAQSDHAPFPGGPAGQGWPVATCAHAILKSSAQGDAARDFLRWLHQPEQAARYFAAAGGALVPALRAAPDDAPWAREPKLRAFRDAARLGRWVGWPALPTAAASAAAEGSVTVDLFARVLAGATQQQSILEAEAALRGIYAGQV